MTQQAAQAESHESEESRESAGTATAADETPLFLAAGDEFVFGVTTAPIGAPNGTAVLCLHAGSQNIASHRNAMYTRLCRELAGLGYRTLRMDYHGSGDSSGLLAERSIGGQTVVDTDAAVAWLLEQGAERVAIVGTCFGGRVALAMASRLESVSSICLISPALRGFEGATNQKRQQHDKLAKTTAGMLQPKIFKMIASDTTYRRWLLKRVRDRVRRAVSRTTVPAALAEVVDPNRAEQGFRQTLEPLVRRQVPIHMLYGADDHTYEVSVRHGTLELVGKHAGDLLDIEVKPNRVHGLVTLEAQDQIVDYVHRSLVDDLTKTHQS